MGITFLNEYYDIKIKKAINLEEEGKYLHALQIYKSLLNEQPDNRVLVIRLADLYDKLNNRNAASGILEEYISENPNDNDVILYFGEFLIKNSEFEKATDILTFVDGEFKGAADYMIAVSYFKMGEYEISKLNLEQFIENNKGSNLIPDAYIHLAKSLMELKNFDEALDVMKKCETIFSLNWEVHLVLAQIYYFKEMFFHAYEEIKNAIKLESNLILFEWAGKISLKLGKYENAEKFLRNSLKGNKVDSEIYSLLGITYLKIQDMEKAKRHFSKALEIDPEDQIALDGISRCDIS